MVSARSRAAIAKYRLTRRKRIFADPDELRRSAESQRAESAQLPNWLRAEHTVEEREVLGHLCYTLRPHHPSSSKHILYLHGGAYVHQIEGAHWRFLSRLVDRTGATISVPLYPLAPTYQYDTTLAMVWETYTSTVGAEEPGNQVLMGDSAGGALSLFLAQRLKARGWAQPSRVVLISPWLDITVTDPAISDLDRVDPYLGVEGLREAGRLYAGDLDPHDPRVSPLYGELEGLAPLGVFTGTRDILLADARRLRDLADHRDVDIDYEEYPGMFHGWILLDLPEAREAIGRVAALLDEPQPEKATRR